MHMSSSDEQRAAMMQLAVDIYRKGRPVIVWSADGKLLHGAEDLETIASTEVALHCTVLRLHTSVEEWNKSPQATIFEVARQLWLSGVLKATPPI